MAPVAASVAVRLTFCFTVARISVVVLRPAAGAASGCVSGMLAPSLMTQPVYDAD